MRVLSVNITATILEGAWIDSENQTGIDKRPISGAVRFENDRVDGDVIGDKSAHGGYDQAVYAYAREDADWWEQEIALTIENGRFGETSSITEPIFQRSPITASLTSTPCVVKFSPKRPFSIVRAISCSHQSASSRAYA